MDNRRNDRGVSELLGGILVFALLLLLLVLAQVTLVPTLNQQIEYEHSLRAQDDVRDVQSGISRVAATGADERYAVEAGVTYPRRPLLINPGSGVQGTVQTREPLAGSPEIRIRNVRSENPETNDYWGDASVPDRGRYESHFLTLDSQYNEYRNGGSFVYENAVLYRQIGDTRVVTGSQSPLVNGRQITFVAVGGEFQDSSEGTLTLPIAPVSAPSRSISVTDDGTPITLTVATRLSVEQWRTILADEMDTGTPGSPDPDDGRYVTRVVDGPDPNTITVEFEPGVTYDLRMAKVGIGSGVDRTSAAYLTRDAGDPSVVPRDGGSVTVQVRDGFNNGVSGTPVDFSIVPGSAVNGSAELTNATTAGQTVRTTSDQEGRAAVSLSGTAERVTIRATIEVSDPGSTAEYEKVEYVVQLGQRGTGDGDDAGEINPNDPVDGNLVYRSSAVGAPNTDRDFMEITFENTRDTPMNVTAIRINSFSPNGQGRSGTDITPDTAVLTTATAPPSFGSVTLEVTGPYVPIPGGTQVGSGDTETFRFTFEDGGTAYEVFAGDVAYVSIRFGNGETAHYLIVGASD